jgi:hypothetical protein
MSYFLCGYKTDSKDIKSLSDLLFDTVPVDKQTNPLRLEGTNSSLVRYGIEKVIPDILIEKENGDSWLALLGTPLIRFEDKRSEQTFLDGFLTSPQDFLRNRIDGNFALLCYDSERNRLIAATDFNNTTPIFYAVRSNGIFFSSHELVLAKFLNAEIDPLGFAQVIHLGVTWGSRTRFRDVFKMIPCQMLVIDAGKQTLTERYWRPEEETLLSCGFDELVANWLSSLGDSVRRFYESGGCKPIMSDLTGGEDTRLLVSQCHALGIPFKALVIGSNDNSDVIVAKRAAAKAGIDLIVRKQEWISEEELIAHVHSIILHSDAYHAFVDSCVEFATDRANPFDDYKIVKLCGVAPAEFRGSYYLKGKAIFPSRRSRLDYKFFARLKFLLDYYPGLLVYPDNLFLDSVYGMINEGLKEVEGFPLGTQIDHVLRVFDSCFLGMKYKVPLYLPYMTKDLTRSLYYIPPHYKQWGRLTRACTEILFPELAFVKTQKGVPTVRMTAMRLPLFIPEYIGLMKSIYNGVVSRLLKWKKPRPFLSMEKNAYIFTTILSREPYCDWFSSTNSMVTGQLYNTNELNSILNQARIGSCRNTLVLGRIINMELACRWVYKKGL